MRKSHHSQLFDLVENIFATSRAFLNSDLSPSSSVFLLKIHLYSIVLWPSSSSSKVYTLFSYMDPLSDFMASSHLSESGPTIAFSITRRFTVAQQHDLQDRVTVPLCSSTRPCQPTRLVVTWSDAQWSPSSASTSIGVGATGTTSYALLHTGWSDGSITSSSSTTLPLNSFERNLSSRKDPFLETNTLLSDLR